MKESHGLFDYDLKDVLSVHQKTTDHVNILRDELEVTFNSDDVNNDKLIARVVSSGA